MDQFDRVIRDIQQKTASDVLRWRIVPPSKLHELAVYARRLVSAHRAEYHLGSEKYELFFVEREVDSFDDFTSEMGVRNIPEVFVLGREGEIVLRLYSGVVEGKDLIRLASLIEGHNEQVTEFFDAFERA